MTKNSNGDINKKTKFSVRGKWNELSKFNKFMISIIIAMVVLLLLWCSLSWLGIWSNYIKNLKTSDVGKDWSKGFVYSLKFLFVNENNKLNWVAIGAIGVLISYWITVKENAKKIDADLVAGARIKWIQEVRKISGIIIGDYKKIISFNLKEEKVDVEKVEEFINNVEIMESNLNSLLLFFGDDSEEQEKKNSFFDSKDKKNNDGNNRKIISLIEKSVKNIKYKQKKIKEKQHLLIKIESNVYLEMEKEAELKVVGSDMPSDIYLELMFENSQEAFSEYNQGFNDLENLYEELKKIDCDLDRANSILAGLRKKFISRIRSYLKIEWKYVSKNRK